jgi:hypothetical protein
MLPYYGSIYPILSDGIDPCMQYDVTYPQRDPVELTIGSSRMLCCECAKTHNEYVQSYQILSIAIIA